MQSTIRSVTLDDIVGLKRYESLRDDLRRRIIDLKRRRRVPVGDSVTFVFENHDTVFFQIQEMLRTERIADLDAVREELAVYNALLPRPGELSATMLIEITDRERVAQKLLAMLGIDQCVRLEIGSERIGGQFDPGHSKEDKLSAVQYVRFALPSAARQAVIDGGTALRLVIDHANYRAAAIIDGETRQSLAEDLRSVE